MQTKEQIVSSLRSFAETMRGIIAEANIKPSQIEIPVETEKLSITELETGLKWLKGIYEKEYCACKETKDLLPDEQWEHYRHMDMTGTIEMKELKERLRQLRKVIINKNRPRIFRRTHAVKKVKGAGEDQQEQGAECEPGKASGDATDSGSQQ